MNCTITGPLTALTLNLCSNAYFLQKRIIYPRDLKATSAATKALCQQNQGHILYVCFQTHDYKRISPTVYSQMFSVSQEIVPKWISEYCCLLQVSSGIFKVLNRTHNGLSLSDSEEFIYILQAFFKSILQCLDMRISRYYSLEISTMEERIFPALCQLQDSMPMKLQLSEAGLWY